MCQKIPVSAIKIDNYVQKKYEELFPENNENNIANIEEDYNACLSNEGFTIDKSEEQTSVMIEGISFELYPKDGGKIGQFAQHTIANLLIHNLIPEQEMQRLLNDQNYCYNTFGICYNFPTWTLRLPLLTKNRINNENRVRYWATAYNGYYVCSQWYPDCKSKLAKWLMNLSKGNLSGYVTAEDDSYNDESVNWAKIKQEEKEKNFAAYFKQQREMEEERKKREEYEQMFSSRKVSPPINIIPQETKKNNSTKNTKIKKSSNSIKKENKKDLPIIVKRNDSFNSTYYQFDSIDGTKTYFARKDGMGNPMPPEFNTKIELVIRKSEDGKIIKWEWDGIR